MSRYARMLISLVLVSTPLRAEIIDHDDIDAVASLPQSVMDGIGQQKWFFTHASVGNNMLTGMSTLHSDDPTRYQLVAEAVGQSSSTPDPPPATTYEGTIYECNRYNPGWETKIEKFTWELPDDIAEGRVDVAAVLNYKRLVEPVGVFLGVPEEEMETVVINRAHTWIEVYD